MTLIYLSALPITLKDGIISVEYQYSYINKSGEWIKDWVKKKEMKRCPHCHDTNRQNKAGKTEAGSQRYQCMHCNRKYTPERKPQGYPASLRKRATEMYVDGGNLRRIARNLKVPVNDN